MYYGHISVSRPLGPCTLIKRYKHIINKPILHCFLDMVAYWILDYNSYEMEIELMSKISAPNLTFEPIFSNKKVWKLFLLFIYLRNIKAYRKK